MSEVTKGSHCGDAYVIILERLKVLKAGRYRLSVGPLVGYWTRSRYIKPVGYSGLNIILEMEFPALNCDSSIPTIRTLLACNFRPITAEVPS